MNYEEYKEKLIVGLKEKIILLGDNDSKEIIARIDSGATRSSIDLRIASELNLGPIVASKIVKSANGQKLRPVIEVDIIIAGKKLTGRFTMADRTHMTYKVLIGQDILKKGFLIDPNKHDKKE